jgi:hypothetical protein
LRPALGQSWQALRPERADQFEAGVRQAFSGKSAVVVMVFCSQEHDRYEIVFSPPPPPRCLNIDSDRTGVKEWRHYFPKAPISLSPHVGGGSCASSRAPSWYSGKCRCPTAAHFLKFVRAAAVSWASRCDMPAK